MAERRRPLSVVSGMEQFRTTPRLDRGPAPQAYASVAWRSPEPRREPIRPANDMGEMAASPNQEADSSWIIVVLGAVAAAVLGMMLGGAMAI
ncbi:hypothetical protein [Brevundimonas lutea]|uniref:hypothetical protein n=1 Tax=Brevundimonas lutea TaxID=2293980 RepID=UPI0013CF1BBE|nr:hypothetical protein [Brevundimonas lutea]